MIVIVYIVSSPTLNNVLLLDTILHKRTAVWKSPDDSRVVFAKFDYTDVTRVNVLETKNSNEIQEQFFYEKVSCVILTDSASHQRCL